MTGIPASSEPALAFENAELAEDALHAWGEASAELARRRNPLVLGALAAGVKPADVERLTKINRSTITRIKDGYPDIEVAVLNPPTVEYAHLLYARTGADTYQPSKPLTGEALRNARIMWGVTMRQAADSISKPPEDPSLSEDAWLQVLAGRYERALRPGALPPASDGFPEGYSDACIQLIREITHIRRLGEAAFADFDPAEVAAGAAHLAEANRQGQEKFAQMAGFPSYAAAKAADFTSAEDDDDDDA
ncbi:hypothetical protein ACWEN6_14045 [Sphaerisporangium sp. NPDC004334]